MLSAKDLSAGIAKNLGQAVPKRGQKSSQPTGSWREEEEIQRCLEQEKSLLEAQRIEKKCMRSVAEWLPEKNSSVVIHKHGKYWANFGLEKDRKLWLAPEETLYLLETNVLELKFGGVSVSVQQAFSLVLGVQLSLASYRVYAKLQRLGYLVFRHRQQQQPRKKLPAQPPPLVPGSGRDEVEVIDLDQNEKAAAAVFDKFVPGIVDKTQVLLRVAPNHLLPPNAIPVRKEYVLRFGGSSPQRPPKTTPVDRNLFHNIQNNPRVNYWNQQRQFQFHMQQMNFRGNFFQAQRIEFRFQGPSHFNFFHAPSNFNPRQNFRPRGGHQGVRFQAQGKQPRDQIPLYEKAESRGPGLPQKRKVDSGSWSELKAKKAFVETITLEPEDSGGFNEASLIQPSDCKNYRSVLDKLQIFKDGLVSDEDSPRQLVIEYDVFLPAANFRKSALPTPQHQVIILSHLDDIPAENEEEGEAANVMYAVVQPDSIQFVTFNRVELKMDL